MSCIIEFNPFIVVFKSSEEHVRNQYLYGNGDGVQMVQVTVIKDENNDFNWLAAKVELIDNASAAFQDSEGEDYIIGLEPNMKEILQIEAEAIKQAKYLLENNKAYAYNMKEVKV